MSRATILLLEFHDGTIAVAEESWTKLGGGKKFSYHVARRRRRHILLLDRNDVVFMKSTHLIDPALMAALELLPPWTFSAETLQSIRAEMRAAMESVPAPDTPETIVETFEVPGPPGAPALRMMAYRPAGARGALPAFLQMHGGGYVVGMPEQMEAAHRQQAPELNCAIFAVAYRLAPEFPHPAALEDCYAALRWMHDNAEQLGLDPARIGVKGDSAGGGLAAALALLARDRGGPRVAFQHLIFPMLDDRTCVDPDPHPFVGEHVWTRDQNLFGWTSLLAAQPGGPDVSPYAAVARAADLRGLPPTFIAVGALDLFLEEDLEYTRRLSRAGVPVELHVYPGAFHGFQIAVEAPVAQAANRDSMAALRRSLHP